MIRSRKLLAAAVLAILLAAVAGFVFADHNESIVHVCIQGSGKMKVVESADDCQANEATASLATEAALAELQGSNVLLQQRLDNLEALVRRLHGNTAAVVEILNGGGGGPRPPITNIIIRLFFCDGDGFDFDTDHCVNEETEYLLETRPVTNLERGIIEVFDADSPDFQEIVNRLTDGQDDTVAYQVIDDQGGTGTSQRSESRFFNTDNSLFDAPVSADPDINDLAGFEIGEISIFADLVRFNYDEDTQLATRDVQARIFFRLAD